jgi:hypothetical protein
MNNKQNTDMKKFLSIKAYLLLIVLLVSCNEDIMNFSDPGANDTSSYFETPEEIRQACNSCLSGFSYQQYVGISVEFDV